MASWLMEDGVYRKVESDLKKLDDDTGKNIEALDINSSEGLSLLNELITNIRTRKR